MERRLESTLILQEIGPVLRSHRVIDEDILSATQRVLDDQRDRARNLFKRSRKVKRVVGNTVDSGFDCSDPEKS